MMLKFHHNLLKIDLNLEKNLSQRDYDESTNKKHKKNSPKSIEKEIIKILTIGKGKYRQYI